MRFKIWDKKIELLKLTKNNYKTFNYMINYSYLWAMFSLLNLATGWISDLLSTSSSLILSSSIEILIPTSFKSSTLFFFSGEFSRKTVGVSNFSSLEAKNLNWN